MPDCLVTETPMRPERDDWATISVQMTGLGAESPRFQGIVRIDGGQKLDLVGGSPSVFRVEPGEHVVSVCFARKFRLDGYPEKAECRLRVEVSPQEAVRLSCGIRPGARGEWHRAKNAKFHGVMFLVGYLSFCALTIAGWLLVKASAPLIQPFVHGVCVWASRFLGLQEPWATLFVAPTGSRLAVTIGMALAMALLFCRWIGFRFPDRGQNDASRIEDPYFLAREDSKCQKTYLQKHPMELSV